MHPNALKARFAGGGAAYGVNLMFPSTQLVEMYGRLGFDWVLIDCEHGSVSYESLDALTMAAEAAGMTPIVRPPSHAADAILRVLDRGAHGIQVPHVNTADDARRVVAAAKFAPQGERGLAPGTRASDYGIDFDAKAFTTERNRETLVCVQIEHRDALPNLEAILAVEGVDVLFMGATDLSLSMGSPGGYDVGAVREAIERGIATIRAAGRVAGSSGNAAMLRRYRELGVQYLYTHLGTLLADGRDRLRAALDRTV